MKYVFAFILLSMYLHGFGQDLKDPLLFAGTICPDSLRNQLTIIASPEMEGRETTTEGQRRAAEYIAGQFRSFGLSAGWNTNYQQSYPVSRDSLIKATLVIDGDTLRQDTDFVVTSNSTFNVSFAASEVLFAGYGLSDSSRDDYKDVNARGKVVMVIPGATIRIVKGKKISERIPDYYTLQDAAQKNGAIAMLIVDKNFPRAPMPAQGYMYVNNTRKDNVPNTYIISDSVARKIMGADYYIARKMMKQGPPLPKSCYISVQLELNKSSERLESSNVIGELEGTDKRDEAVVITAHYDHLGKRDGVIYFGADDDGSGTASVIELARAFSNAAANGARPRRTIIFMTVSGEEKGLWGSSYYAENPVFPLEKTSVDLNIDMIGRTEDGRKTGDSLNYVYVIGDNRLSSDLRTLSENVNAHRTHLSLDYKYNDPHDPERIYYRSDHYNFAKKGVPVMFYFAGLHRDYHRPTDTPDKINYNLLSKRAQFVFYTAWEMANREDMLKRDLP
jgi:hypothetical protein